MEVATCLLQAGKVSQPDLQKARQLQQETAESLQTLLVRVGRVSESDMAQALAESHGLLLATEVEYPDFPLLEDAVSPKFLKQTRALPLAKTDAGVVVAMADPGDTQTIKALRLATGQAIQVRVGLPSEIDRAYERLYGGGRDQLEQIVDSVDETELATDEREDIDQLRDLASEAPVIRMVNLMIFRAVDARASDVHVEPFSDILKVRYRIDGVMHEMEAPPTRFAAAVISRIKLMAELDIAERRVPQDGRMRIRVKDRDIDLRIATVPTVHGESVEMRILDRGDVALDFAELGFSGHLHARFQGLLDLPNGILLVTGPTGSGKTTTLYAALQQLNTPDRKILTVEDPVEYQLEGVNQIQVKPQVNLTFANALRAIVRQDPDVIMVGEMRDLETAGIAVQSALTGHTVLSTLHTNDAASGVTRLLDMGVEDYLLGSTINGILAQRLVRQLCPQCKEPYSPPSDRAAEMGISEAELPRILYQPYGCRVCAGTGFFGRILIGESLIVSPSVRRLILDRAESGDIERQARHEGMITMFEEGVAKVEAGVTTLEEVLRVTRATTNAEIPL